MTTTLFQERSKEPDRPRPNHHTSGVRILLVEDDRALAAVVEEALTAAGHTVTSVPDGASALASDANDLVLLRTRTRSHRRELGYYLGLAGCEGEEAERVKQLSPGGPDAYVAESAWYLLRKPQRR